MAEEEWVFLIEATNETEADIICGFLQAHEVPAKKEYSGPFSGLKVVMGQEVGVISIFVPSNLKSFGRELLKEIENK